MTIEQNVEIPAGHDAPKSNTPVSDRLAGELEGRGDIDLEAIREKRLEKYL